MSVGLRVRSVGPGVTLQDMGRTGWMAKGVSRGGAADTVALYEGAALLGQEPECAAIEMAGMGASFQVEGGALIIALTGAPMTATLDGEALAWNATHALVPGQTLTIGAAKSGVYGYLHLAGGVAGTEVMGSRSVHRAAGIGHAVSAGDFVAAQTGDGRAVPGLGLEVEDRFSGGPLRLVPSAQTARFDASTRARFCATAFSRDARGNRMGVRLNHDGAPFQAADQLGVVSEMVVPGDVQIGGDGAPYALMSECQTTGGYPRIGTILPQDMARLAQAAPGAPLRFEFVAHDEALASHRSWSAVLARLPANVAPRIRDPRDMTDLLSYQLISGAVTGREDPGQGEGAP